MRGYRRGLSLSQVSKRHERRHLRCHYDEDGALVGSFRLDPEDGAALLTALQTARQCSAEHCRETPRLGRQQADADALVTLLHAAQATFGADRAADNEPEPANRAPHPQAGDTAPAEQPASAKSAPPPRTPVQPPVQVMVHLDPAILAATDDGPATGRGELEHGPGLHPQTLRRLCCEAAVVGVVHSADGGVLDVG